MAEAPGQRPSFENLPPELQNEIFPGLSASDAARLAAVSMAFNRIINNDNNPVIWIKMAKKLNITVSENPKEDVLAYYRSGNEQLLQYFANNGHNIPRVLDVFLQRKMIEDYIKANLMGTPILEQAAWLGRLPSNPCWSDPQFQKNVAPVFKFLIEIGALFNENIVTHTLLSGNMEVAKLLIEANNPYVRSSDVHSYLIIDKAKLEIFKLLVDAKIWIHPNKVEFAEKYGTQEIANLLREAVGKQNVNQNPKEDIVAYYGHGNRQLLQYFTRNGHRIPTASVVFLQRKIMEDYVKENLMGTEILENAAWLGRLPSDPCWSDPQFQRNVTPVFDFLIEIGAPLNENIVTHTLLSGNMEVAKLLIEAKNPYVMSSYMLTQLIEHGGKLDIIKLLIDARATIIPEHIDIAEMRGQQEIANLLREAMDKQNRLREAMDKQNVNQNAAYYTTGNEYLLQYFASNGHNIPRAHDAYQQRRMIEDYVKANLMGSPILENAAWLGLRMDDPCWKDPEFQRSVIPVFELLIKIGAPLNENIVGRTLLSGNMQVAKLLIEAKNPEILTSNMLTHMILGGNFDMIKLLVDAKVPIKPHHINMALERHQDGQEVAAFLRKSLAKQNE